MSMDTAAPNLQTLSHRYGLLLATGSHWLEKCFLGELPLIELP